MSIKNFKELVAAAAAMEEKTRIVVVNAQDEHTLDAIVRATKDGIINPILVGDVAKISEIITHEGDDPAKYEIIPAADVDESLAIAVKLIQEGKGNVLMMHGHPGQTAEVKRTEGAMDILAQNPDMTLLDEQTADWDRAEAMTLMENWIQAYGDQINAVFCQNDEMALGALNALVQAGKKDNVLVVGVDAIDDALQSVKDGKMDATVYQDCKGQAEGAIEAAYKLAKGESVEKEILIPFILVTTENVDEYLK